MQKLVSRSSSQRKIKKQPKRTPKRSLIDLPYILFEELSGAHTVLEERSEEIPWPIISIYRYDGLANLQLHHPVQLRRLNVEADALTWIGYSEGSYTNVFFIGTGEAGFITGTRGRFGYGPRPVLIIEAGHPPNNKDRLLPNLSTTKRDERYKRSPHLIEFERRVMALYEQYERTLQRKRVRNGLLIPIGGGLR